MGYGSYILPSGKAAGYMVEAVCEHPGCNEKIDRGMGYACGGDAGDQGGCSCEGYFCGKHRYLVDPKEGSHELTELGNSPALCAQCVSALAYLDRIEEAEEYRKDSRFHPNKDTLSLLKDEGSPHL